MAIKNSTAKLTENTWIADSGATCHITNSLEGMFDLQEVHECIKIGTGEETYATKCGKLKAEVMTQEGIQHITLQEVRYIPGFYVKLFSLTSALKNGAKITSEGLKMIVANGPIKLEFTKCMETKNSFVSGLELKPLPRSEMAAYTSNEKNGKEWHQKLGHVSDDIAHHTAKYYGFDLNGKENNCEACALGKSRQMNMNKEKVKRADKIGEQFFIDIASTEYESYGKAKFWLLVVDDSSNSAGVIL